MRSSHARSAEIGIPYIATVDVNDPYKLQKNVYSQPTSTMVNVQLCKTALRNCKWGGRAGRWRLLQDSSCVQAAPFTVTSTFSYLNLKVKPCLKEKGCLQALSHHRYIDPQHLRSSQNCIEQIASMNLSHEEPPKDGVSAPNSRGG